MASLAEWEASRAELVVGKRVGVWYPPPATSGRGVIVELVDDCWADCAVLLDDWDHPLGFYWHEVFAERSVVFDTGRRYL
jgi:hypothetical protein